MDLSELRDDLEVRKLIQSEQIFRIVAFERRIKRRVEEGERKKGRGRKV